MCFEVNSKNVNRVCVYKKHTLNVENVIKSYS